MLEPSQLLLRFDGQKLKHLDETFDAALIDPPSLQDSMSGGDYALLSGNTPPYAPVLLATRKSPLGRIFKIVEDARLDFSFPSAVEEEVRQTVRQGIETQDLVDLTDLPFVTVDGEGTKDLDQALYVADRDDVCEKRFRIRQDAVLTGFYAIADASHFVPVQSELFKEALKRGSSQYFCGMSVPMLPRAFSTGLISLNPDVERRALVFVMQLNAQGDCVRTDLIRATIRSRAKLTNEEVESYYEAPSLSPLREREYTKSLDLFRELGELRILESARRNVLVFNRVSLDVNLTPDKKELSLDFEKRDLVSSYNEQFSLLCNIEGAKLLLEKSKEDSDILTIFKTHESPSEADLNALAEDIRVMAGLHDLEDKWIWHKGEMPLSDYLEQLPESSLFDPKRSRIRQAIERQILMMQRRSVFSGVAGDHSALGVNPYARLSSPMREIVGIYTHRELISAYFDIDDDIDPKTKRDLRQAVIQSANAAKSRQNRLNKDIDSYAISSIIAGDYKIDEEERPRRPGTVMGMKDNALYIRLDSPPIELKVYKADMEKSYGVKFRVANNRMRMFSEDGLSDLKVGDKIEIYVESYNEAKNRWRVLPVRQRFI